MDRTLYCLTAVLGIGLAIAGGMWAVHHLPLSLRFPRADVYEADHDSPANVDYRQEIFFRPDGTGQSAASSRKMMHSMMLPPFHWKIEGQKVYIDHDAYSVDEAGVLHGTPGTKYQLIVPYPYRSPYPR